MMISLLFSNVYVGEFISFRNNLKIDCLLHNIFPHHPLYANVTILMALTSPLPQKSSTDVDNLRHNRFKKKYKYVSVCLFNFVWN